MKNIVLLGFMGTGKTGVAKQLAHDLNLEFIEMDSIIESREGIKINEIFAKKGEPYFRKIESDVVNELSNKENLVISAGGGVVLDSSNIDNLRKNGILICLDAQPEEILRRVSRQKHRPLLNIENPLGKINELLKVRKPYYDKIHFHVETTKKNIKEVVSDIKHLVGEAGDIKK